jgi:sec-independent protein translocase protein TatA
MSPCFFDGLGTSEMVILVILGLLLFGGRLPEVGRSLGKNLAKLKKSMSDMAPEVEKARAQINEVSQGLRNAAHEVTAEVRSQIDAGLQDPGRRP